MSLLLSSHAALAERLGLDSNSELLALALTHSSYAAEHAVESNERLEFLGDAVVDLAVADLIVRDFPQQNEGASSVMRSRVVNESSLASVASRLGLGDHLRFGRGAIKERGRERPSILADAFEAVVAAIYLERGYDVAREFVQRTLAPEIAAASTLQSTLDPKTRLVQWAEQQGLSAPHYELRAEGPSHDTHFEATVSVGALRVTGSGPSKKRAESDAAQRAWQERQNA